MMRLTCGLIGAVLLLTGCSSATSVATAPGQNTSAVVSSEFHPSDAALLGATGRPQLVEFFAYW